MRRIAIFALLGAMTLEGPAQAAFRTQGAPSIRARAMGHAFAASADEAAALFANPAGISRLPSPELSVMFSKPLAGLPDTDLAAGNAAVAFPTSIGTMGLGIEAFQAASLVREQALALSYAVNLPLNIQAGVTGKHLTHTYMAASDPSAADDPVFAKGFGRSAVAVDAGVMASLGKYVKLGASVRNINQPDVGLMTEDPVARETQAGILFDLGGLGLKLSADALVQAEISGVTPSKSMSFFGAEKTLLNNKMALRAGATPLEFTAGFGLALGRVRFDYAVGFMKSLREDNAGSHHMAVTYRFGSAKPAVAPAPRVTAPDPRFAAPAPASDPKPAVRPAVRPASTTPAPKKKAAPSRGKTRGGK